MMSEQHLDIRALTKRNISYFWIPTVDYMCPRNHQIETFLLIMRMNSREKVLINCELGRGRSAFFCATYLIELHNYSINGAIKKLKEARPEVKLSPPQLEKLRDRYTNSHVNG